MEPYLGLGSAVTGGRSCSSSVGDLGSGGLARREPGGWRTCCGPPGAETLRSGPGPPDTEERADSCETEREWRAGAGW